MQPLSSAGGYYFDVVCLFRVCSDSQAKRIASLEPENSQLRQECEKLQNVCRIVCILRDFTHLLCPSDVI